MSGYLGTKAVLLSTTAATVTGSSTVGAGLTVDNDGATVLTVDRATSDGTIIDVQKDGTNVGSIGSYSGSFLKIQSGGDKSGTLYGTSAHYPLKNDALSDADINLGGTSNRFKDLYLSGGVYLGGTGAANLLDDYEEGSWTPSITNHSGSTSGQTVAGRYTKVGRICHFQGVLTQGTGTVTGQVNIEGFPFTAAGTFGHISFNASSSANLQISAARVVAGSNSFTLKGYDGTGLSSGSGDVNICFEGTFQVS